jgi:hypothetical protein
MTKKANPKAPPDKEPLDAQAADLRKRGAEMFANATEHAQRLLDVAGAAGLAPNIREDTGSAVYGAVLSQLELAARVVEHSQVVADRLIQTLEKRSGKDDLILFEIPHGGSARKSFVVKNSLAADAVVNVSVEDLEGLDGGRVSARAGRQKLGARKETSISLEVDSAGLGSEGAASGVVRVRMDGVLVAERDFEVWVTRRA